MESSLFLLERLQKEGKIPDPVQPKSNTEPTYIMNNGLTIPQMAFGLYLVPADEQGEQIIVQAIDAGYRHFDTATYYDNEATLGKAIAKSGIPRNQFFLCSKVWNDAQKGGRQAVRASVLASLEALGGATHDPNPYWDLFLIHWPVPGYYIETYKELEELCKEGKLKSLGISNFSPAEYDALVQSGITVLPAVQQMEVSPVMYRPRTLNFFQNTANVLVSASKALNRGSAWNALPLQQLAAVHAVSPAQIMLRWAIQKGLIVVTKTATLERMSENRNLWHFFLSHDEMNMLDALTTEEVIQQREALEEERKRSL
jgi:diketogulonate reductase-like aldo/keto reductase